MNYYGMDEWPQGTYVYYNRLPAGSSIPLGRADIATQLESKNRFGARTSIIHVLNNIRRMAQAEASREINCLKLIDPGNEFLNIEAAYEFLNPKNEIYENPGEFYNFIIKYQTIVNQLLQGKNNIENYLDYIFNSFLKQEESQLKIAPNSYAFVGSMIQNKIATACQQIVRELQKSIAEGQTVNISSFEEKIRTKLESLFSPNSAFMTKIIKEIAGTDKPQDNETRYYDKNLEILLNPETELLKNLRSEFAKNVYNAFGIDSLIKKLAIEFKELSDKGQLSSRTSYKNVIKDGKKTKEAIKVSARTTVNKNFGTSTAVNTGKIYEFSMGIAAASIASSNPNFTSGFGFNTKSSSAFTTDSINILTTAIDLDWSGISSIINNLQVDEKDGKKQGARNKMMEALKQIQSKLDSATAGVYKNGNVKKAKSIIILTNNKLYSLRRSDGDGGLKKFSSYGFSGGERSIKDLPFFMSKLHAGSGENILLFLINTLSGAKLEGRRDQVESAIALAVINNVLSYLFDDFENFTFKTNFQNQNSNVIHAFNLDGVTVTASGFLYTLYNSLSQTINKYTNGDQYMEFVKNAEDYVKVNFSFANNSIEWPASYQTTDWINGVNRTSDGERTKGLNRKKQDEKRTLLDAWNTQRDIALSAKFEVTFFKQFENFLRDMYSQLNNMKGI